MAETVKQALSLSFKRFSCFSLLAIYLLVTSSPSFFHSDDCQNSQISPSLDNDMLCHTDCSQDGEEGSTCSGTSSKKSPFSDEKFCPVCALQKNQNNQVELSTPLDYQTLLAFSCDGPVEEFVSFDICFSPKQTRAPPTSFPA